MGVNCNLELSLMPPSLHFPTEDCNLFQQIPTKEKEQQQLTIFYNGKVVSCDVTELQARAIILLASQEEKSRPTTQPPWMTSVSDESPPRVTSVSDESRPQVVDANPGLSMKRSLKQFLQKRKSRHLASSPYHRSRPL